MKNEGSIDKYGFFGESETSLDERRRENARENKWMKMIGNWAKYQSKKRSKLKKRIRKGIPAAFRGRVWYILSGAEKVQQKGLYKSLIGNINTCNDLGAIEADLNRTFPTSLMYRTEEGTERLRRVLGAYSLFDPELGYTQGMSYLAALFLLFIDEESSFWVFVAVMRNQGFRECYIRNMPGVSRHFYISNGLFKKKLPRIYHHFDQVNLSPSMYATHWFMTGFTATFPINTIVRIWDCLFSEGTKILYRVHLSILMHLAMEIKEAPFEEVLMKMKEANRIEPEHLLRVGFKIRMKRSLIERFSRDFDTNRKDKYVNWVIMER